MCLLPHRPFDIFFLVCSVTWNTLYDLCWLWDLFCFFSLMSHQFLETLNEPWEQVGKYVGNGFCGRNKMASGEVIAVYKKRN